MAGLHFCNPCCKSGENKGIKEFREFKEFNETGHSHSDLKRPIATYSDLPKNPQKNSPNCLELWPTGCTKKGGKQRYFLYAVLVLLFVAAAKKNANSRERNPKLNCYALARSRQGPFVHICRASLSLRGQSHTGRRASHHYLYFRWGD